MEPENSKAQDQIEAIGAAMGLTAAVSDLTSKFKAFMTDQKKLKRLTKMLIVSLVLDLILTVGIGFLSVNNHTLNERLRQAQIASCEKGNITRADDVVLWTKAINDIDPSSKITTPQETQDKKNFLLFVDKTFAPLNCNSIS